ncbi:VCBS repeat protein [Ulvibacter sp. MAR_2010_11]|uniref:FG-GAP-like repeat-containing protein n=1 Tax=Ulvibacter sp. MAR_2010_11 TaxID=1250229 RepID=UPI000C2B5AC7|nr:FG-GAP-like repeat-containing protein [Ulvibacter sp. MAR_2010_11]PKA83608.1 VCBS repeat protein [Ulvibacter sp. MAR_2010_11]
MVLNYKYLAILLFIWACKDSPKEVSGIEITPKQKDFRRSTDQMIDSIQTIISLVNFRNHPYESAEKLKLIEQAVTAASANNQLSIPLYIDYGKTLLNAGKSQEAIDVFETLLEKLPENKVITKNTKGLHEALAISYMRLAEQINCRDNHSAESCLFPIKGKGIHTNKRGSQKAIEIYKEILKVFPDDLQSRWLLNLAYMTLDEYPQQVPKAYLIPPSAFKPEYNLAVFQNIAMNVGLDVNGLAGGVIVDDFNNDDYIDIIVSSWGLFGNVLYFENNGDGSFTNKTEASGLSGLTGGLNLIQADYNNDGHLDFFICRGAWSGFNWMGQLPNSLLKNNGDGTFTDVTITSGLYAKRPTQSAVWLDFNNDGWLDLYVGNETHSTKELNPAQFFLNTKDGAFKDVAPRLGLNFTEYIKGVNSGDINNDGLPDIYISILNGPNKLLLNKGGRNIEDWKFENIAPTAGVSEPIESFPTWFFDFDNDGWEDIFVTCFDSYSLSQQAAETAADYLGQKKMADLPRLYRNTGSNRFENVTKKQHLDRILPAMGCNYGDLDNDGFLDFYLGTGAPDYRAIVPNRMFRNNAGIAFQDVTYAGNFGHIQKGHGIGFADLDNDGDQDIYAVMGGSVSGDVFQNALYENPGTSNQWITVQLQGTASNRSAIGARIKITLENHDGSTRTIYNTVSSGGSFGANSLQAEIGLGNCKAIKSIAVNWPDGKATYTDYGSSATGVTIKIIEGNENLIEVSRKSFEFPKQHTSMAH